MLRLLVHFIMAGTLLEVSGFAQELKLHRYRGGESLGTSELRWSDTETNLRHEGQDVIVTATVRSDEQGWLLFYEREVRKRSPDVLVGRVRFQRAESGFSLREQGPLGSRSRDIPTQSVRGIVDPTSPELLIPLLMREDKGLLRLFVLASESTVQPEIRALSPTRRRLELPTGETTVELTSDARFQRLVIGGAAGLEISGLATPAAPLPEGVVEESVVLRLDGAEVAAMVTRPEPCPVDAPGILLLGDALGRGVDSVRADAANRPLLRDLAHAWAKRGRITLRFARRDGGAGSLPLSALADDAGKALDLLRSFPGVEPRRVGILGHGEGAYLALALAKGGRARGLRGAFLLGLPMRKLENVLLERLARDLRARGEVEDGIVEAQAALAESLTKVRQRELDAAAGPERLLRDLLAIDPMSEVADADIPLMILHGEEDQSITAADRALLPSATLFSTSKVSRSRLLEGANHDFSGADGERHPDLLPLLEAFVREFFELPSAEPK